jgi:7-carboxy-7-deazaguanine synthase
MNDTTQQKELLVPVAERFHSLQGEGLYTGTPMHFIRLAGCTVGKSLSNPSARAEVGNAEFPLLKTGAPSWLCHTYDGRRFWCDTDFGLKERIPLKDLLDDTWEKHICLTGGEPLAHIPLVIDIITQADRKHIQVHLETSGTIDFSHPKVWLTVAPKFGCLESMIRRADEIKILVDADFRLDTLPYGVHHHPLVWLQPVNNELSVDNDNLYRCINLLSTVPKWRLSVQLHKIFNWR